MIWIILNERNFSLDMSEEPFKKDISILKFKPLFSMNEILVKNCTPCCSSLDLLIIVILLKSARSI